MQKDIGILTRMGLIALTLISLSSLCVPSAEAVIRDKAIVGRLNEERNALLTREKKLLEDYDDLQRQIRDLQKRDSDAKAIDTLARDADQKYADLKQIQFNLRQVDMKLM